VLYDAGLTPSGLGRNLDVLGVARIVPGHCTGWRAVHELARAMPDAFAQPAVGTVLSFASPES